MKLSKPLFSFIFLIIVLQLVSAPPPVFDAGTFTEGFEIKIPLDNEVQLGKPYEFEFHVYNISNGMPIIEGISCVFHLYNETGKHIVELVRTTPSHIFDYGFYVSEGNFTKTGENYYNVQCNNSALGGFHSGSIHVSPLGREPGSVFNNSMLLILGLLGLCLIIFGIAKPFPAFAFIGSLMFVLIGVYTMINGFDGVVDMYTRGAAISLIGTGFIIMFASAYEWIYSDEGE